MDTAFQKRWVEALAYPAMILNQDLIVLAANQACRTIFEAELTDVDFVRILRHPDAIDLVTGLNPGDPIRTTDIVLRLTTNRTFEISAARIDAGDALDARGVLAGRPNEPFILFTLLDVSAELDAEKSRSTFVANVSHELRSPLTTLMGVVETLQGPARKDAVARDRFLDLMSGEILRMSRLVGDLLSLSKMEAKEHLRPTESVALPRLIESVISSLSASNPDYPGRLILEVDGQIPPVLADHDEITDVFRNLIENALKYSAPEQPVTITIAKAAEDLGEQRPRLNVKINDRGEGIDSQHLPRLTERFYRVDKGRSREMGGTGLGLAIAKHSLNRHRAKLSIESEVGIGTTVTVTFIAQSRG